MPTALLCRVCSCPAATDLVVGRSTLTACAECARRLIDGEFFYAPSSTLRLKRPSLQSAGDGPLALPARAVH